MKSIRNKNEKKDDNKTTKKDYVLLSEIVVSIIIIGLIIVFSLPSVRNSNNDRRQKEGYIELAKDYMIETASLLYNEDIVLKDTNTTLYIPISCIPNIDYPITSYGELDQGYVVVTYTGVGNDYNFYFTSRDTANMGIYLTAEKNLTIKSIQSNVKKLETPAPVEGKDNVVVLDDSCTYNSIEEQKKRNDYGEMPAKYATAILNRIWFKNSGIDDDQVKTIEIVNHQNIPKGAYSWNAGEGVKAWRIPDGGMYKVYIGADKGIRAPDYAYCLFCSYENMTSIDVTYLNTSDVTDMSSIFFANESLERIYGLEYFDTSKATDMSRLFFGIKLKSISEIEQFDTSNVTNMSQMFEKMTEITELNLKNFKTKKVTDMSYMFSGDTNLKKIYGLEQFDTFNVTEMYGMFENMKEVTVLDLRSFNTRNVKDIRRMFFGDEKLIKIYGLEKFDTSNVTEMYGMFENMKEVIELDLSSFNTRKVTDMRAMFSGDKNLTKIYVSDNFVTSAVTISFDMFDKCIRLKGSNGTIYDEDNVDVTYARIDKPGKPGYFSKK